ncbi:MAG: serine hydrolase, partial [Clostridiales bacterium]|nr:serine hydrolase [Clostridiales bacterium]
MKKIVCAGLSLIILISSLLCAFSANAAVYTPDVELYSKAYMLINLDDDSYPVVAQKNQDEKMYPASLTKIVTAMVTLNNVKDIQAETTMSESAYNVLLGTGAQVAGLKIGETLTIGQLLYLTMVHSACDATEILAEYVGGTRENFVKMMNDYAASLGCKNTNFVNPDGLHDDNHYTTASDMAKITLDALKNSTFTKIAYTVEYKYKNTNYYNTNLMLRSGYVSYYYKYAKGIKTGSTSEAGYCVITTASKDGYN